MPDLGRKVVTAEEANVEDILAELEALGVERTPPVWTEGPEPGYPRGIGPTKIRKPKWSGTASDKKKAAELKRNYSAAFDDVAVKKKSDGFWRELTSEMRAIDEAHNAALWATVREEFDYPVFVAAPKSVGITSTGDTGDSVPNELPALLEAYRAFEEWVEAGAKPEDTRGFLLPSAA